MGGVKTVLIVLLAGLLVFGCTGPSQPSGTTPQGGNQAPTQPSGNGGTGADAGTGTGDSGTPAPDGGDATGGEDTSGGGSSGGNGGLDLAGMGFEAIAGLGAPVQCDITTTYEGKSQNVHVYMKGSQEMRSEFSSGNAQCAKMVSILKGNTFYYGCDGAEIMPGYQWMKMEFDPEAAGTGGGAQEPPDFSDVPPAKISCAPWMYDASKFAVSGKICDFDKIMECYGMDET